MIFRLKRLTSKVQGAAGDILGDRKAHVEGAAREVPVQAQKTYGQAKEVARSTAAQVGRGVEQQPITALFIAGVIGYVLGLLTARR